MAKRKRWAIIFVFLSLCIFGYQQFEVALASPDSPQTLSSSQVSNNNHEEIKQEKISFRKEGEFLTSLKPLTLDGFIEETIKQRKEKMESVNFTNKPLNSSLNNSTNSEEKSIKNDIFMKKDLFAKDKINSDSLDIENLKELNITDKDEIKQKTDKIRKLASYISETYNIDLDKAEKIVYSTFVEANKKNLEPMLVLSVISIESTFQQYSKSPAGAVGLTQIMPKVHKVRIAENKVDIWSVHGNIKVGTDILKDYVQLAGGNMRKALQMYNGSSKDKNYRYSNQVMKKMQNFMVASK